MRTSSILTALFPAVRQEILAATLLSPERSWYLSELAAHLNTSPSSLQRELDTLAKSRILQRRQEGWRIYYRAETASPVFTELRDLFSKTAGMAPLLQAELAAFGSKIAWAAIYGSIARGEEGAQSDIDFVDCWPRNLARSPARLAPSRASIRARRQRNPIFGRRIPRQAAQRESLSQFHPQKQSNHDRGVPR